MALAARTSAFGSLADVEAYPSDVCFTPESGHLQSAVVPHVLAMVEDGNDQTSNQQRAANDSAREIDVMSGAVRLAPSHEREYVKRLGHVREHHDDEASRTEQQKSCCCRTSAHAPEPTRLAQVVAAHAQGKHDADNNQGNQHAANVWVHSRLAPPARLNLPSA